MQDREVLRALLTDVNAPPECVERALSLLLPRFASTDSTEKVIWETLASPELRDARLRGPQLLTEDETVRVSRVLPLDSFTQYYLRPVYGYEATSQDLTTVERMLSDSWQPEMLTEWGGRYGICWVTRYDDIQGRPAAEIADDMGGLRFVDGDMPLVSVSYDLPRNALRVPTAFDASFDPSFLSKPTGAADSRAWNWTKSAWGITEAIHAELTHLPEATVQLLGRPGSRPVAPMMAAFAPPRSLELEKLISQTLRQSVAHAKLLPFFGGERSVLDLTPREFEAFVATVLERSGYEATVTKVSHDGGFDVIAIRDAPAHEILLVQVKKTINTVGISVLRELIGARVIAERIQAGPFTPSVLVLATTRRMSREVTDTAALFGEQIRLIDYVKIQKVLAEFSELGVKDLVEAAVVRRNEVIGRL